MSKYPLIFMLGLFTAFGCSNETDAEPGNTNEIRSAIVTDINGHVTRVTNLEAVYVDETLFQNRRGGRAYRYEYFEDDKLHILTETGKDQDLITDQMILPFSEIEEMSFDWTSGYVLPYHMNILMKDQTKIEAVFDLARWEWNYTKRDKDNNIIEQHVFERFTPSMSDYRELTGFEADISVPSGNKARYYIDFDDGQVLRSIRFEN